MRSGFAERRFTVGRDHDYIVIRDAEQWNRPAVVFLANKQKPHAPRYMAEICARALNEENRKYVEKGK